MSYTRSFDSGLAALQQQVALKKQLEAKLSDLQGQRCIFDKKVIQVSIDGFLRFADYFFDGLFADWAVGDKISESMDSVTKVKGEIRAALSKLEGMEKDADAQIHSLEAKIEELLVNG